MKILSGFFYMKLPDDFNGSIKDALAITAEHASSSPVLSECSLDNDKYIAAGDKLWKEFSAGEGIGGKYTGYINIQEFDQEEETWNKLEEI